jgi:hypothetical protein
MSAFDSTYQIVSIYYWVHPLEEIKVPLREKNFDFDEKQLAIYHETGETETFRLISLDDFGAHAVSLPIDKVVADIVDSIYKK